MNKKQRQEAIDIIFEGLRTFENGEKTKKGKEIVDLRKNECKMIGFIPSVMYIKPNGTDREMESLWVHPFAQRTLLFKHNNYPILIISNSSVELDDSALRRIKGNENVEDMLNILGITG